MPISERRTRVVPASINAPKLRGRPEEALMRISRQHRTIATMIEQERREMSDQIEKLTRECAELRKQLERHRGGGGAARGNNWVTFTKT